MAVDKLAGAKIALYHEPARMNWFTALELKVWVSLICPSYWG